MAMKYQQGTVYLCGQKVKMWYGKYLIYGKDQDGKEVRRHRNIRVCPKANTPKWKAEQLLREIILKEAGTSVSPRTLIADDSVTFRWFVTERYIPDFPPSPIWCMKEVFSTIRDRSRATGEQPWQ